MVSLSFAFPLDYRVIVARSMALTSNLAVPTYQEMPTRTMARLNDTKTFDLATLGEGNQKFMQQRLAFKLTDPLVESPPIMFIGCSDNRLSPQTIFQTTIGGALSHFNLANQFKREDLSAQAAVTQAVERMGVQHIVVLGHYGCDSVHKAMDTKPMEYMLEQWLRPVVGVFTRSKRFEIKKLINSRRWHDDAGAAEADDDAFHALVEENVKATVMNLRNQGVLSNAYSRRNKTNKLRVFVHGLVVNEETGVVMDLNVSFGPPEQTIPKLPFEVIVKQKRRNSFGKFKPKATKLEPTATSTAVIETTPSSLPTRS